MTAPWGTPALRRLYAAQACREALRADRGVGFYRHASEEECAGSALLLRTIAAFHDAAAKKLSEEPWAARIASALGDPEYGRAAS